MSGDLINSLGLYRSNEGQISDKELDRLRVDDKKFTLGIDYDRIDITYPNNVSERFEFSLNSEVVRTVLVTYLSAVKRDISTVEVLP